MVLRHRVVRFDLQPLTRSKRPRRKPRHVTFASELDKVVLFQELPPLYDTILLQVENDLDAQLMQTIVGMADAAMKNDTGASLLQPDVLTVLAPMQQVLCKQKCFDLLLELREFAPNDVVINKKKCPHKQLLEVLHDLCLL